MVTLRLLATCTALIVAAILAPKDPARAAPASEKREFTPRDAMATVRVIENQLALGERVDSGVTSPNGRRYLLRLIQGDTVRNGVWMDLLTGSLNSLESAARPKPCAHLFTTGLGSIKSARAADADADSTNLIHWINDTQVAFLWSDAHAIRQVMSVDVTTCKPRFVTHSATDVFSFMFTPDGSLLFNAQVARAIGASQRLWKHGFTISDSSDGWSILKGQIDGADANSLYDNAWFICSPGGIRPIDIVGQHTDRTNAFFRDLFLSNSGQLALIDVGIAGIPAGWEQYTNPTLQSLLKVDQSVPGRLPLRYALIDLKTGDSRLLWDAPRAFRGQVAWSPNSKSLLLAPTFLPLAANSPLGLSGAAAAELDVRSGQYQILPVDLTSRTVVSTEWLSPALVEIRSTNELALDLRIDRLVREDSHWRLAAATDPQPNARPSIYLETRQSLNRPPQVFAVESASGQSRLVLDPNPHLLEQFKLGRVERLSGTLSNGKQWIAQLTYPADYIPGTRYPLVIQSYYGHPFGPEEFSLDGTWGVLGMGLGPSLYASYPGQLLATRNIAVLTLSVMHLSPGAKQDDDYQLAFESLAQQLIASGIADPLKVALAGFSRNGHWVEFTLAHSALPFAAAIAADNYDPSYMQSALSNWRNEDAQMNAAPAFGEGLQKWLARAVGFNAEYIHTPLYIIGQAGGLEMIISEWEIFSRLRYLKKPVEMYMMPEVGAHPAHLPQNPRQILSIQDHAIDWLSFWLTGREDPSVLKLEQYRRWHAFQESRAVSNP
jgi:hypothetical protein